MVGFHAAFLMIAVYAGLSFIHAHATLVIKWCTVWNLIARQLFSFLSSWMSQKNVPWTSVVSFPAPPTSDAWKPPVSGLIGDHGWIHVGERWAMFSSISFFPPSTFLLWLWDWCWLLFPPSGVTSLWTLESDRMGLKPQPVVGPWAGCFPSPSLSFSIK